MIALTLGERPSRSTTLSFLWGVRTFPPPPQFYRYRMWGWVTRDKKRTQSGWRWMQTSSWSEIKDFQKSPWTTHFFGAGILCSPLPRLVRGKKKPDRGPYSRKLNRLRARNLPIRNRNLLSSPLRFLKKNPYVILAMTACINIVHSARNGSRIIIFQSKHIKFLVFESCYTKQQHTAREMKSKRTNDSFFLKLLDVKRFHHGYGHLIATSSIVELAAGQSMV